MTLAACSTDSVGGGGADAPDPDDLSEQMVGAMTDFGVGSTFVATEPVEFSMLYRDHPNYPYSEDWSMVQHLADDHNVTFEMVNVPMSDFEQRRNLLMSAGDAPQILPVSYVGNMDQFVPSGVVLPISRYLEHMPNFTAKIEAWGLQEDLDRTRQLDGEFYVLPGLLEEPKPQYSLAVRKDLWDEAGLNPDPATWEEFAEQLAIIAERNPDLDYPMSERWMAESLTSTVAPGFDTVAGWGYGAGVQWDGSEYVYAGAQPGYRDMLAYLNGLVTDGLLDPESFTQPDEQAEQKFATGRSAVIGTNDQTIVTYQQLLDDNDIDGEAYQIVVPAGPAGNLGGVVSRFESGVAISANAADSPNFVAMLQYIDWLYYSDDGLEFAKWGVEGETFEVDADGARQLMPDIDVNGLNPGAPENLQIDYGYSNGVFMPAHGSTKDLVDSMSRPEVVTWRDAMNERTFEDAPPPYLFDELQAEQAALQSTPLTDSVAQNSVAFILGQRSLDEWDAYVSELESSGMQTYLDMVNEATRVE